ncbi:Osiris 9D [Operophtera brumata]|uniref:Osiris 9D n=1 Tax=Operophtera brumata TaxID=104452 RepID=A0A0L7KRW0_OPEBR|nr:Osiris 9D [Operophtera brumata]
MKAFVILVCAAVVASKPTGEEDVLGTVLGVVKTCSEEDVSFLIGNGSPRSARSFEPLSEEPRARENQVENRLVDAAADFLENHVLQLRVPKGTVEDVKRSLEEGRGKKKKLKQLIPIFGLLQLKIQALIPLFLGIIAFAAVKGLLLAKAALLASALLLLKKLLSKGEQHESYEVVAHPHHEEHFSHGGGGGGGHGGWGRSGDAQNLAYSAYAN